VDLFGAPIRSLALCVAVRLVLSFRVSLGSGFSVYRYRFRRLSPGSARATASVAPGILSLLASAACVLLGLCLDVSSVKL
jgi:hypothetical protein